MTNTHPHATIERRLAVAVMVLIGALSLIAGAVGSALVGNERQHDTAVSGPPVRVPAGTDRQADPTDGDKFGAQLDAAILAASYEADTCIVARPGVEPPSTARSALVERRGEEFNPNDPVVVFRMRIESAVHSSTGGLVLVHRWCDAAS
jgi:hypothetical protein